MQSIISYSKVDQEIALRLYSALVAMNINIWIDRVNILPGVDWEKNLEQAIKESNHMLLLLSESSIRSIEVEAEWNLAKSLNIVIIPILLTDIEVPFRIRGYQHLQFEKLGFENLVMELLKILPQSKNPKHLLLNWSEAREFSNKFPGQYSEITLSLDANSFDIDEKRYLLIRNNAYSTVKSLLDEIYLNYLTNEVPAYSYGADWVVCGPAGIIVPFQWIDKPGTAIQLVDNEWISSKLLYDIRFYSSNDWSIISKGKLRELIGKGIYGVGTNNFELYNMACAHPKSSFYILQSNNLFKKQRKEKISQISPYAYQALFVAYFPELAGNIYIEAGKTPNEVEMKKIWAVAGRLA